MTAEVAIMNRSCVALAADSAFTDSKNKVRVGNKLFSLSPINDIGIMIYGSSAFLGYPWEVLIKSFRSDVKEEFETVQDCANKFKEYIASETISDNEGQDEELSFHSVIFDEIEQLSVLIRKTPLKDSDLKKLLIKLKEFYEDSNEVLENSISISRFRSVFLEDAIKEATRVLEVDFTRPTYKKALSEFLFQIISRHKASDVSTGVVFAGYGKKQFFPELLSYQIDGKFGDCFRFLLSGEHNMNKREFRKAVVFPFAQRDMVDLFMEGIAGSHTTFIKKFFTEVLNDRTQEVIDAYVDDPDERIVEKEIQKGQKKEIISTFSDEFETFTKKQSIYPVVKAVELLPREEMAAMAEALVELTSLKRRVVSTVETVGGPTDVAVISKGEGLVWIKRKHYFASEMNPDFILRKSLKMGVEE